MERRERAALIARLRSDARRIAGHFGLEYKAIRPEHPRVKAHYGLCTSDGEIKIRLNHAKTGRPLKYSSLIDTLCHELAHLKHFNHGPEFKDFFFQLLGWARRQGIYRPGPRRGPRAPAPQLQLEAPLRRNGVPIFAPDAPAEALHLPWEEQPARGSRRAPAGPQQLSLF